MIKSVQVILSKQKIIAQFWLFCCRMFIYSCWLAYMVCWEYTHINWMWNNRFSLFRQQYLIWSNRCVGNVIQHVNVAFVSLKTNMKPFEFYKVVATVWAPVWTCWEVPVFIIFCSLLCVMSICKLHVLLSHSHSPITSAHNTKSTVSYCSCITVTWYLLKGPACHVCLFSLLNYVASGNVSNLSSVRSSYFFLNINYKLRNKQSIFAG